MRLDILAQILADADLGLVGGPNASIFTNQMNADCKEGIMLRLPVEGVPVDVDLPNYYKSSVQIIVRSVDQATGDARIKAAVAALRMDQRTVFTNIDGSFAMQINHLVPRTLARDYPRLDGQSKEWTVDLNANYVMPT